MINAGASVPSSSRDSHADIILNKQIHSLSQLCKTNVTRIYRKRKYLGNYNIVYSCRLNNVNTNAFILCIDQF